MSCVTDGGAPRRGQARHYVRPSRFRQVEQPTTGYDYDTFAADLHALVGHLKLFPPYLLKAPDNVEGVDKSVFDGIETAIKKDRYAFFTEFFKNFYNADKLLGSRASEEVLRVGWNTAAFSSPAASLACVATWYTDFRKDVAKIAVPTLVLHGDADRIVPLEFSGARAAKSIKGAELVVIKDGPHNFAWTHADETNVHLVRFFG